jgi:hypothetical protein
MVAVPSNIKQRILILAPIGRDAELISGALGKSGLVSEAAPDLPALCRELEAGAAAAIVAEEALTAPAVDQLLELLEAQQPWSELPVMVLLSQEPVPNAAALGRVLEELNATLLERPISMRQGGGQGPPPPVRNSEPSAGSGSGPPPGGGGGAHS